MIDKGSSYDLLYSSLFGKICLDRGNLIPYDDSDLQEFNGITTRPWRYKELMVFVGEDIDIRSINTQFFVTQCISLYNCILGIPFTIMLDGVASHVHLKLKYHNLHGEPVSYVPILKHPKRHTTHFREIERKVQLWRSR